MEDLAGRKHQAQVSLKSLKVFARERLPANSMLAQVILAEDDEVFAFELAGKARIWLALLRVEGRAD